LSQKLAPGGWQRSKLPRKNAARKVTPFSPPRIPANGMIKPVPPPFRQTTTDGGEKSGDSEGFKKAIWIPKCRFAPQKSHRFASKKANWSLFGRFHEPIGVFVLFLRPKAG